MDGQKTSFVSFIRRYRSVVVAIILALTVFDIVMAFQTQFYDQFNSMSAWNRHLIGDCGGQNHYTSGGQLHMRASYGTDCFGAYWRREDYHPGTFPRTEDIRVMWRWRYTNFDKYGTQAGQVTGNWGWPQYYGMSAVNTGGSRNDYHVISDGDWGAYQADEAHHYGRNTNWHTSTFDWLCDGTQMKWWVDSSLVHQENNSAYYWPPSHESRPFQFWMGNLLSTVPSNGSWTQFDMDYVYIYSVQRPQMNTPGSGSGGTQAVSWNTVPNTTQPDGSTWGIEYRVRACTNASCGSVQQTSNWQSGTNYTFTGLPLNRTYHYQAQARWVGTPELKTCWGNTLPAQMTGEAELSLSKTATAQQEPGGVVNYSLTLANTGDAPAYGVVIRDPLPSYITNPTNISGGGSVSGGDIVWNIGTLNAGASTTVSWRGTVNSNIPRTVSRITNVATATDNANHSDTAQASTTILMPDMRLTKTATTPAWPSADITFNITVDSIGQGTLRNIVITDPIPAWILNVRGISDNGTVQGNQIVWNLGNLSAGGSNTLTWQGTLDPVNTPANYSQVVNNVTGTASTGINKSAQAISPVRFPQMTLIKEAPPRLYPGGQFVYTITVQNSGNAIMKAPVVRDPIPPYVTGVRNISNGGNLQNGEITWTLNDLNPGDSQALTWEYELDPLIPTSEEVLTNTVTGSGQWSGIRATDSAVSDVGRPIMQLTKIAPTTTWPNADIDYTILVENTGNAPMFGIVITDTVPDYIINLSGISHAGNVSNGVITWNLTDIVQPGSRVILSWHGQVDPNIPQYETDIINRVSGCAVPTCDTTSATSVLLYPDMYLTKSAPARTWADEAIDFTITVRNTGQAPMYDVVITDPIPDWVLNPQVPAGSLMGSNVVWEFPEMAPGETQALTWSGTVDPDVPTDYTTLINKVYGTALSSIAEYAETMTVVLFPNMNLLKTAPAEVWPGSAVEYTIRVENTGAAPMEEVIIRDFVPDYVLNVTDISHGGTMDRRDEIVWDLGDMNPGAFYELTWQGTVDPYIPTSRTLIRNQVQGNAARGVSAVAEATSLVLYPSLIINKSGTVEAAPGDTVQFVIEVQNASAAPVQDVVVKDFIPKYIIDPSSISYNGYVEGNEIIWEIGSMTGGETLSLAWEGVIDLAVPLGQKYIDNTAEICDGLQRYCDNALYRMRILQAEARVTKNAIPYGWPGSEVEYTIIVQNTGETDLQDVVIRDPLPKYMLYPRDISHGGQAVESPFEGEIEVVWDLGDLAVGELVTLAWKGSVAKDTPVKIDAIENIATLTSRRGVEREGVGSTYIMHPELRLLKRATAEARPGDGVDYSITLENASWIPAYNVEVHDIIPPYLINPANVDRGGEIWADEIYWLFEEVAPGQVITMTWQGQVDPEVPVSEEEIINVVRANDMTGVEAEAEAVTDLVIQDIVLRKAASYAVQPDGDIAYSIEVENRSDAPISGITITDPVPEYVLDVRNISGGGLFDGNTNVTWELAQLDPDQQVTLSWEGTVGRAIPAEVTAIWNEVTLTTESGLETKATAKSFVDHPVLSIDKTVTPSTGLRTGLEAGPGDQVDYTIVVKNLGRGASYDVEIRDLIPDYLNEALVSGNGVVQADEIYWTIDSLQPGEVVTTTWSARVDPYVPPTETEIVNVVTVSDAGGNSDTDQAVTNLLPQQLFIVKDATPVVYPGGIVSYTITLENRGEATLYDVAITDPLPEYVLDARDISGGGLADGNANVIWDLARLDSGQTVKLTWTGTVDPAIPGQEQTIWNEVELVTGSGLAATAKGKSLVRYPLLLVDKTATLETGPGDRVDYTIVVRNSGQAPAYAVEVIDPIPEYLFDANSGDGPVIQADEVYWTLDILPAGEEVTLTWSAQVDPAIPATEREIVNTVSVVDIAGNTDTDQAVTRLIGQAAFINKTATYETYPGGSVVYTITVQNRGEATLYDLVISDPIPEYVEDPIGNVTISPVEVGSGGLSGNTDVVWEVPALARGDVITMTWQGTVARSIPGKVTDIWNEATLTTAGGWQASALAKSFVRQPALAVAKTATPSTGLRTGNEAGPGEQIDYTILVGNSGEAPAYEVEVFDIIPDYIVSPGGAGGGDIRANEIYWTFDMLQPGEVQTLSWSGFVDPDIPETETEIVNTVTAVDVAGNSDQAQAVTNLPGQEILMIKDGTYMVYPGGDVVYTITVRNQGDATLYGIVVRDPVPTHIFDVRNINGGGHFDGNTGVVWSIPALAEDEMVQLTWTGTVDQATPAKVTTIWNEANLTTEGGLEATATAKSWVNHPTLAIEKVATPSTGLRTGNEAGPGGRIDYSILVRNSGQAPAYAVEVHDPIPEHIVSPSGAAGGQIRADEVFWYFDTLQPGEEHTLSWQGYVDAAVPPEVKTIVNTISVQDVAGNSDEDQAVTNLVEQRLDLAKAATYDAYPGGGVAYTVTVRNRSDAELYGVTVIDAVPENVLDPANISGGGYFDGNTDIIWELPLLAARQSVTLTWDGVVDRATSSRVTAIWNEASATTESGLTANAQAKSFVNHPTLAVTKQATIEAGPGEQVDYTIVLENPSSAVAYAVEVHDPIPAYIVSPSGATGGEIRADEIFWTFDELQPGQVQVLSWSGLVEAEVPDDQTEIVNTVTVVDAGGNADQAQAVTKLVEQRLDLAKTATYDVYPGGEVVYTITLRNLGSAEVYGVTVTDPVPEYVLNPTSISGGGLFDGNTTVTWNVPVLNLGQTLTLSWQGTVARATPAKVTAIWNQVSLVTDSGLTAKAQAKSFVRHPTLAVTKSATTEAGPGEPVDYTIVVENPSQAPAYEIEVHDPIPAYIVNPSGAAGGDIRADEVYWLIDTLLPGETVTLNWSGAIDGNIPETVDQIVNRVTVQDVAGNRDEAQAVTNLLRQRIDLAKTGSYVVYPGGDIVYTLTVRNRGNAELYGITVTDPVPEYVLDVQGITGGGRFDGNTAVIWELAQLNPNESVTLSWAGSVDPQIPDKELSITNEAGLVTESGLVAEATARSLVYHPTLVIDKVATTQAGPGNAIDYTIVVKNPSQAPSYEVEVHDPIPEYIVNPVVSGNGVIQAEAVYWRFDEMLPGEVITLTWSGEVDPETPAEVEEIANTVTARDVTGRQDEDQAFTSLLSQRVDLVKTASYIIYPGGEVVYTVTLRSRGSAALYDLTVTDPVPEYILDPRDINLGGRFDGNTEVVWELARIDPAQTMSLTWRGTLDPDVPVDVTDIWNEVSLVGQSGLEATARARSKILRPALIIVKLAPTAVGPGDPLTYTVILENIGPVAAVGVEVEDPIPGNILNPINVSGGGVVDQLPTYEVRWRLGDLAAGERRTLTWQGTVDPYIELDPATTTVVTNGVVAADDSGTTASAGAKTMILQPQVDIAKAAPEQAGPGERVAYTIRVTNTGQTTLRGLAVTDPVPEHITLPTGINAAGRLAGGEVVWNLGSLAVNEALTLSWAGTVDIDVPSDVTLIRNQAKVTAYPDLAVSAEDATRIVRPQVELVKSGPAEVGPGGDIAYSLTVSNTGQVTLFGVTVTDIYPAPISPTLISHSGVMTAGHNIVWTIGDMAAGEVINLTWSGQVDPNIPVTMYELENRATLTALAGLEATSEVTTTVRQPRLRVDKRAPEGAQPGGLIEYQLDVTNVGQATASGVSLEDIMPAYVTPQSIEAGGYEVPGRIVWALSDLAPGEQVTVGWQGLVDPAIPANEAEIKNVAIATASGGLEAKAEVTSYLLRPGLNLVKVSGHEVYAGGEITYTLRLSNDGDGLARDIELRDPLPRYVTYVPGSVTNHGTFEVDDQVVVWEIDLLQPGESVEMGWAGQVAVDIPSMVEAITNRAEAVSPDATVPATVTTAVVEPDTTLVALCPAYAQAGDVLSYTLRLHSTGGTLAGPELTLPLPDGATLVPGSVTHDGQRVTDRTDDWGEPLPDELVWQLDTLGHDEREQLRFALLVSPDLGLAEAETGGHIKAEVFLASSPGEIVEQAGCETTLFVPALVVDKVGPERAIVDDIVDYTLTVTNTGLVVAHNAVLTDTILPGVNYLPGTASHDAQVVTIEGDGEPWEQVRLVWQLGDLEPGEQVSRSFEGQMYVPVGTGDYQANFSQDGEAIVYNEAVATAERATPAYDSTETLVPRPTLELERDVQVETGGVLVSYSTLSEASVSSPLAGPVARPVSLELAGGDGSTLQSTALTTSPLTVASVQAWPGSELEHTLIGVNTGPGVARQATLVERIPADLEVVEGSISDGGYYQPVGHRITWALGDLAEGEQVIRTYTLRVPLSLRPGYQLLESNQATLSSPDAPSVYANVGTDLTGTFEVAAAKLATDKAEPGEIIDYVIRIRNISPNPVDQVIVSDSLPEYTTYVEDSASLPPEIELDGRTLKWNLGMFMAGETRDVHFRVLLDPETPDWHFQVQNEVEITFSGGSTTASAVTQLPLPPPEPGQVEPTPGPGDDDPDPDEPGEPGEPPSETPVPPRSTAVVPPFVLTPTVTPGPTVAPLPTPLPAPGLSLAVDPATVPAGQVSLVTWRLSFSNPTPLMIGELVVRDLLPQGLLYVDAETSRGEVTLSPRSGGGRDRQVTLPTLPPGQAVTSTPTPADTPTATPFVVTVTPGGSLVVDQAGLRLPIAEGETTPTGQPTAVSRVTAMPGEVMTSTVTPVETVTVTATGTVPVTPALDPTMAQTTVLTSDSLSVAFSGALPGVDDVPLTEVVFNVGDVPPGGRIEMVINTLVLGDALPGTVYDNIGTYAAANVDPGTSNHATVTVKDAPKPPPVTLPVTGGLLDLVNPRTLQGKVSWAGVLLVAAGVFLWRRWRRK